MAKPIAVQDKERTRKNNLIACAILALLGLALYGNTIPHDYALDDAVVITKNKFVQRGIAGIPAIFSYDSFKGFDDNILSSVAGGRYRPLSLATFAIERSLFGSNPQVSHLINVLLYAFTGILLFIVLGALFKKFPQSGVFLSIPFLAAAIFIAHPVHTEAVANIKSRDELLAFLFSLLTMQCLLRYFETDKMLLLLWAGVSFFLALLSKESAAVFIFIIPLTFYYFTPTAPKKILQSSAPLAMVLVAFIALRYAIVSSTSLSVSPNASADLMNNSFAEMSVSQKYATIMYTLGMYLKLLFFPHPLTWDYYPYHIGIQNWTSITVLSSLVIYLALIFIGVKGLRSKSFISYCILLYLIPLSLTANILFPVGAFMGERFLYMPSLGFALLLAYVLVAQPVSFLRTWLKPLYVLLPLLALYSAKTIARNRAWKDSLTIIETDIRTSPESVKSNLEYGRQLYFKAEAIESGAARGNYYETALLHLEKAFEIYPNDASGNFMLGTIYGKYKQDMPKSIYHLNNAMHLNPNDVDIYNNLGVAYGLTKQYDKAIEVFQEGLKHFPDNVQMQQRLNHTYEMVGKPQGK